MNEGHIKEKFTQCCEGLMHGAVVLSHTERLRIGIPDTSVTWAGTTSWWELKYHTRLKPFETPPLQKYTCTRLAAQGTCFYVIFVEVGMKKASLIVRPEHVTSGQIPTEPVIQLVGFEYPSIAAFIRLQHLRRYRNMNVGQPYADQREQRRPIP